MEKLVVGLELLRGDQLPSSREMVILSSDCNAKTISMLVLKQVETWLNQMIMLKKISVTSEE